MLSTRAGGVTRLADGDRGTALLDFEWARFGEPADDWFFVAAFSGPHIQPVRDVIAEATGGSAASLAAECDVREAAYVTSDLAAAVRRGKPPPRTLLDALRELSG